ncbi:MAG: 16S rRNA (guanine(966)-N(2))-methyltransferase RsmD [Tissierellia bacterium]|nr:16S rRNA (guanine(966)-N(2))-methyltransferase RsmD [Tissierellia bacterium]
MRIITGKKKGLKLISPKGDYTRPTESRIKESLFNILGNVTDSIVCDLFAGSGAIGLEFLSRGAKLVYFVENDINALTALKSNLKKANLPNYKVIEKDYVIALNEIDRNGNFFDFIYVDPPYDSINIYDNSLKLISELEVFRESLIIVESDVNTEIKNLQLFNIIDKRKYRSTILYFLRRQ